MMLPLTSRISSALLDLGTTVGRRLSGRLRGLCASESGATAIEYGLIVAGISLAVILIVFAFGNDIAAYYQAIDTRITASTPT